MVNWTYYIQRSCIGQTITTLYERRIRFSVDLVGSVDRRDPIVIYCCNEAEPSKNKITLNHTRTSAHHFWDCLQSFLPRTIYWLVIAPIDRHPPPSKHNSTNEIPADETLPNQTFPRLFLSHCEEFHFFVGLSHFETVLAVCSAFSLRRPVQTWRIEKSDNSIRPHDSDELSNGRFAVRHTVPSFGEQDTFRT